MHKLQCQKIQITGKHGVILAASFITIFGCRIASLVLCLKPLPQSVIHYFLYHRHSVVTLVTNNTLRFHWWSCSVMSFHCGNFWGHYMEHKLHTENSTLKVNKCTLQQIKVDFKHSLGYWSLPSASKAIRWKSWLSSLHYYLLYKIDSVHRHESFRNNSSLLVEAHIVLNKMETSGCLDCRKNTVVL